MSADTVSDFEDVVSELKAKNIIPAYSLLDAEITDTYKRLETINDILQRLNLLSRSEKALKN